MRCALLSLLGVLVGGACAPAPGAAVQPSDAAAEGGGGAQTPLPARTWRLSHAQYARAVQQFVGVTPDTSGFEPELDNGVYPNMSGSGLVDGVLANDYYESAERIAQQLPASTLQQFAGGSALSRESKPAFLQAAVRAAFRRPPRAEDLQAYGELFDAEPEPEQAFRAVIQALLSSPHFLYRSELGADPHVARFSLTPHEQASLLSFSLLDSPPSAALLAAADSGKLDVAGQVDALLDTAEAKAQLGRFLEQWLEIHHFDQLAKDLAVFPEFEDHKPDMWAEATRFIEQTGGMTGTVSALLTTPVVPSAEALAFYASDPSAAGDPGTRTGVMALAPVIATHSRLNGNSPTLRGLFVRERMLCQSVHLPPGGAPNIVDTLFLKQPRTTRELYAQHALDPVCASCHVLLDSIGFNFEDFDAIGRHRTLENGVPIDTSGELVDPQVGGATRDSTDLAQRLADSDAVRACFARQMFRFYLGLVEPDEPTMSAAAVSGSLRELVAELMQAQLKRARARQL